MKKLMKFFTAPYRRKRIKDQITSELIYIYADSVYAGYQAADTNLRDMGDSSAPKDNLEYLMRKFERRNVLRRRWNRVFSDPLVIAFKAN